MSSPNSKSHEFNGYDDLTISEMNSSTPVQPSVPISRAPTKDEHLKVQKRKAPPQKGAKSNTTKFTISLTRKEIEEDIFAVTGKKPRRSHKKRSNTMKKNIDELFPGSSLDGHDADSLRKSYGLF
ncbi:hypothetical protein L6452_20071 [Arctium lappa]|uniref:Uncharacterized protein n=1 Tax=Arctium lappa TaxID=4217 RepID=A0ACB9B9U5_ARCLA|nr:hypothetical protein L6452_20071 [Arctium lappa]